VQDYRRLDVWRRGRELALAIYRLTEGFPRSETFGLVSQMRRSAVSVVSNIAEGASRGSDREFARFIRYALGSAAELECQLDLCHQLGYVSQTAVASASNILDHVKAMLLNLDRRL
jgi:four helix bundle protein